MTVHRATLKDLDVLTPLFDLYRIFYLQAANDAACRQFLKDRIEKSESVIFIAMLDGEAVGFVQLYPAFSSVRLEPIFILNDLYVAASFRKKGVATALLNAAKKYGKEVNAARLLLETGPDNFSAKSLYLQNGWVREESLYFAYELKDTDRTPVPEEL